MKNKLFSIFATILAVQTYSVMPVFSQVPDTSFTPSDGLVFGSINPEKTVILKLVNKTSQILNY
ncbi:MAG: hypothetical protein ACRDB1_09495, partial [Microcoleaceae cyanobacterium]